MEDTSRHLIALLKTICEGRRLEAETFNKTFTIPTYIVYIQFGAVETKVLNNVLSISYFGVKENFTSVLETEHSLEYSSCKYDTDHG